VSENSVTLRRTRRTFPRGPLKGLFGLRKLPVRGAQCGALETAAGAGIDGRAPLVDSCSSRSLLGHAALAA
jgi:hypothetical protein